VGSPSSNSDKLHSFPRFWPPHSLLPHIAEIDTPIKMASGQDMMSGVVDPELLYTKQNCIGMQTPAQSLNFNPDIIQAVVALARSTKGEHLSHSIYYINHMLI
jgi:hypothetical protein